jgi:ABC-type lipoprotein export system ATPase subunit
MIKLSKEAEAKKFLGLFDGDLEAAMDELHRSAALSSRAKVKISSSAPVVIETQSLTKKYKLGSEKVTAISDINIKVQQGEFVAITGTSGSGKSTLLQLIGGLDKPSEGKVLVGGQDISQLSDAKLSSFRNKTVGFVFQFFYLQPFLTTSVNLEVPGMFAHIPKSERQKAARQLAESVGLADRLNHLPKELSGGQMQRAAIARALLNKPKVLLADEPTGNLDQTTGLAIIDLFEKIRQLYGTTIVVVTHDRTIASRADREFKLSDGKLIGQ